MSPILFYDPLERVVATLHPNHTYEKVVFDPWRQVTYDVNDTVADDPRTDPDISGFVSEYFKLLALEESDWKTWLQERGVDPQAPPEDTPGLDPEIKAAIRTLPHADTPATAHLDTVGRTFLTVADNGPDEHGEPQLYSTRVELDIENNQRSVIDALGRIVMRYDYDMLSNRIHQGSMEAGERWILNDVTGKPIRSWDSRGFIRRMTYDELRRPTGLYITEKGTERLAEQTIYGEAQGDAKNHRTRVYQLFDAAGIVTNGEYDFKGNLSETRRDLLPTYSQAVDWQQNPAPSDGSFTSRSTFDALNRPLAVTSPDGSVYHPTSNEANLLETVDVNLRGAAVATTFVKNIDYNAKGQRELIEYGCGAGPSRQGVTTTYGYDPDTFRLTHLKTTRPPGLNGPASQIFRDPAVVQDLRYTYDPAGNITRIEDAALKPISYNNEQVDPVCSYTYDAIYRLIEAQGREHIAQTAFDFNPPNGNRRDYPFVGLGVNVNDMQAIRNYTEQYE